ncbi:single-stranded DNA-binding protein [Promicromonospora vindobonensis]|uniref:Single-stranded DNA-binding protein n=1 Tax=Promicromonospora vindobonensis TaxID=195748 RepID=A0ABW5W040_9MICO
MNDVTVTVSGFAGNTPALHVSKDVAKDLEWTTFRVASTRRYLNESGDWTDGATLWFTVKAWRTAALNVIRSVRKGVPVVVTGRLEVDEWTGPDGAQRTGLVINATAVGVDATRGQVEFSRTVHHDTVPEGVPGAPGGGGGLAAVRPGAADPFGVDAPRDETDHGAEAGSRTPELVNA